MIFVATATDLVMTVSLGELLRLDPRYADNIAATHAHDGVVATDQQLQDAQALATEYSDQTWQDWLLRILCTDNRIPFSPFDPEQVDC